MKMMTAQNAYAWVERVVVGEEVNAYHHHHDTVVIYALVTNLAYRVAFGEVIFEEEVYHHHHHQKLMVC